MAINTNKIALLHLTLHDGARAWKGHDWEVLNRPHRKGSHQTYASAKLLAWLSVTAMHSFNLVTQQEASNRHDEKLLLERPPKGEIVARHHLICANRRQFFAATANPRSVSLAMRPKTQITWSRRPRAAVGNC